MIRDGHSRYVIRDCITPRIRIDGSHALGRGQLRTNMSQHGRTWRHLGANVGPIWAHLDQLGPTWANLGPTWSQFGANLDHHGATWGQLGTNLGLTWGQLGPTWINLGQFGFDLSQHGPTWAQLEAHTDLKIMEKPLFLSLIHISEPTRQP